MKHTLKTFFVALVAMMVPIVGWGQTNVSTFYLPYATAIPDGSFAYTVAGVDGDYIDLKKVEGVIPAGTATLISQVELQNSGYAADLNYLCGTAVDTNVQIESDYSYYVLEESEGTIWLLQDINVNEGTFLNNAFEAYLKIPKTLVQDKSKLYIRGLSAPEQVDPSTCSHTTYNNGFCSNCGAYEPAVDSNSDGYYEIGNAGQLYWFANYVNSGNYSARAVLTADIDLENRPWTPIGLYNSAADPYIDLSYSGTFDGQKHIIKNLNVHVTDGREAGFFSRTRNASLSNFGIVNATIVSDPIDGSSYRAGVVGGEVHLSTVNNVYTSGNLSVTTEHEQKGGFAGECHTTTLYNCYTTHNTFTSTIEVTANNCFYLGNEENASSAGTFMTAAQMASGEMAYKLGAAYGQTIGTDALPVFDGAKVYYGYTSCGAEEKIYTNDDSVTDEKEHHFADGICTECGDPYVPKITLALYDDYGDGWNGCAIIVKKNDEVLAEVTIEEGSDAIHKIEYDSSAKYTFYWKEGNWSEECSFVISVEEETVYNGNLSGDWRNNTTTPFLTLTTPYTLAFSANGGVGSHVAIKALRLVTLPECNFLAPDGKEFSAWRIGESEYQAGDVVTLTENAVAYAVWKDATIAMGTLTLELHDINCESISRLQNYSYYTVTKDGELCATIRLEDDFVVSKTLEYDPNCEYAFYWHTGSDTYDTPIVYIQLNEESLFDGSGSSLEHRAEDNPFLVIPKKTRPSNVSTLNIIDGELPEYNVLREAEVGTLTYQRTLPNLEWNALFLPFEIPLSELEADYEVAYFNDMHSYDRNRDGEIDELEMEIILIDEGTLHANHPYFIRATSDDAKDLDLVLNDVTICETENAQLTCSSVYTKFDLNGSYAKKSAAELEGCYAISTEGVWAPLADGTALNPFRFYLEITQLAGSPVKVSSHALKSIRIRLNGQGDTTDIQEVPTTTTDAAVYDLSGRRVVNPGKGVYIVNDKKVMMK